MRGDRVVIGSQKRCVLYARLSVTKEESVSIARQLEACRKYAEGRGWEVIGEFVDDGVSATVNRPQDRKGWKSLLLAAGFDAVIIWKVDRLARRVLDFLHVDEVLQKRGAGLVAVEDPIDMTTPMGRAFATILAVFGEMEAAAIAARVRASKSFLIRDGRWTGGGYPYGYMPVPNPDGPGFVLAQDPTRIDTLKGIVSAAQRGETVNAITTWLNRSGAPLPRITEKRNPRAAWNRQTVIGILRNPTIAGMTPRNPGRKKYAMAGPGLVLRDEAGNPVIKPDLAIIAVDEFESLQELLDARSAPQAKKLAERKRTSAFLSKVARCDDCDVYMCRGTNQGQPVLYCPRCRQTISRIHLDPYLEARLIAERGGLASGDGTVLDQWKRAWNNDPAKRQVLLSQLDHLRIRRGKAGIFDPERILLEWTPTEETELAA